MAQTDNGQDQQSSVPTATLLVVYSEQLAACRDFYSDLGLDLVEEQHGTGPVHYASELAGGLVLELYPGPDPARSTGRLRLGFTVAATAARPAGEHKLTDPDGRVVVVTAVEDETPMPRPEMPEGATWEGGRGGARARQFEPGDEWLPVPPLPDDLSQPPSGDGGARERQFSPGTGSSTSTTDPTAGGSRPGRTTAPRGPRRGRRSASPRSRTAR